MDIDSTKIYDYVKGLIEYIILFLFKPVFLSAHKLTFVVQFIILI